MVNTLKTAALLAALSALFIAIGGSFWGQTGMTVALGFALLMNLGSYWFSDRLVLRMYRAREVEASHPLARLTAELAQRAGLPMPRVYIIPTDTPNAFATGRNPRHAAVAATEGILRVLDRDELAGVIAHELAHIQNRDILISTIAATVAAAIMYAVQFGFFFGGSRNRNVHPLLLILMVILAPIAATVIQLAISRSREFAADATGARIAGRPDGLARALGKIEAAVRQRPLPAGAVSQATEHMFIVKPLSAQGMGKLFSSHPPTAERVRRLMGTGA